VRKIIKSITLAIAIILLIFTVIFLITALFSLNDNSKKITDAFFGGLFFSLFAFVLYFLIDKEKRENFSWKRVLKKIFLAGGLFFMILFIVVLLEYLLVDMDKKEFIDVGINSLPLSLLFFIPFILIKEDNEEEKNSFYALFTRFTRKSKKSIDNKQVSLKNNPTKIYKFEKCENCNSSEVVIKDNVYICAYCGAMLGVKV